MLHSFLIIGQSNMAGRGYIATAPGLQNPGGRLKVLRNGRWQPMYRPVNPDRFFSGTCLAESFALAYSLDHPDVEVGIIPCADGGTSLEQWAKGSLLFDNAVNNALLAMRTSNLAGILWHQGEADCADELYPLYYDKVSAIMSALRKALGCEDIPIVVGGLGDFLKYYDGADELKNYPFVNKALESFAQDTHNVAFASAEGLTSNPDNLHFCHEALMEFGLRYYEAFKTVEYSGSMQNTASQTDDSRRSKMEQL